MRTEHQTTREEEAFGQLLEETKDTFSEAVHTILSEADAAAYADHMVHNYSFHPQEYEEAMERMRSAATNLTEREHQLLAKIWRKALAAAASIDAEDFESSAGHKVSSADLHHYYRTVSSMIETTLEEKRSDEIRKEIMDQEPLDDSDIPF